MRVTPGLGVVVAFFNKYLKSRKSGSFAKTNSVLKNLIKKKSEIFLLQKIWHHRAAVCRATLRSY